MNISLCTNFLSFESLFSCFFQSSKEKSTHGVKIFRLTIDRRVSTYHFDLDTDHTRVSILDVATKYLNNPNLGTRLPGIFRTPHIRNRTLVEVMHQDIAAFYKNIILATIQDRTTVKLHIVLNDVHILITSYPIFDNKKKIIGCTLLEIPYMSVPSNNIIQQASMGDLEL